ncbi:unnamed protein product, partial [Didymodactylos carnosus]
RLNAFLYDAVVLDYYSGQDDECKLRVVGNWYAMTGYGIGFPKQSKFKAMIDKEIIALHHSGEIERLRRFWFTGACRTNSEGHSQLSSSQKLGALDFISAFFLLFAGTGLATIILLWEYIVQSLGRAFSEYQPISNTKMTNNYRSLSSKKRENFLLTKISILEERIKELENTQLQDLTANCIQTPSNVRLKPKLETENDGNQLLFENSLIDSSQNITANNNNKIQSTNMYVVLPLLYTDDTSTHFETVKTSEQMSTPKNNRVRSTSRICLNDLSQHRTQNESINTNNTEPTRHEITMYESVV